MVSGFHISIKNDEKSMNSVMKKINHVTLSLPLGWLCRQ